MKKDIIIYEIDGSIYINLTNKCSNDCVFCVRNHADGVGGHYLWLSKEPALEELYAALSNAEKYKEAVFCGFGEPTYRVAEIAALSSFLREKGVKTRLNTNGLANLINGRDVSAELAAAVDVISVSLNATDAEGYDKLCRSMYGLEAFPALLDFSKKCVAAGGRVVMSVVDSIGKEEIEKSRKIAQECGAEFRVRAYIA